MPRLCGADVHPVGPGDMRMAKLAVRVIPHVRGLFLTSFTEEGAEFVDYITHARNLVEVGEDRYWVKSRGTPA